MKNHATLRYSNTKYSKISLRRRQQLVRQVLQKNQLVSKTARKLHLSLSTAKLIVKRFKEQGTFFESKADMTKRQLSDQAFQAKAEQEKRTPPIKQNSFGDACSTIRQSPIIPQLFYFDGSWIQPFPLVFLTFEGMMFSQL